MLCRTLQGHAHWVNILALSTDYVMRTGAFDPRHADIVYRDQTLESKWYIVKDCRYCKIIIYCAALTCVEFIRGVIKTTWTLLKSLQCVAWWKLYLMLLIYDITKFCLFSRHKQIFLQSIKIVYWHFYVFVIWML